MLEKICCIQRAIKIVRNVFANLQLFKTFPHSNTIIALTLGGVVYFHVPFCHIFVEKIQDSHAVKFIIVSILYLPFFPCLLNPLSEMLS